MLSDPSSPRAADDEISWQLEQMSAPVVTVLARLPMLGEDSAGPLGSGLLASGDLGANIRAIQDALRQQRLGA